MRCLSFLLFFVLLGSSVYAQNKEVDSLYLEDQFYVGVTYNTFADKPANLDQRNLPYGLQLGFIKDLPINKNRTVGFGLGLGYAVNNYYSNLVASKQDNTISYVLVDDDFDYTRSKIETHLIEMPIEFRWRRSTPTKYKFFRIYAGAKLGYVFSAKSKFVSDDLKDVFKNTDVSNFRYGLQFNIGYNTWNIHVYYGLNSLLDNAYVGDEQLNMKPIRIGFNFYIL
ncbi:outer membrane protein with beta-barrel domain [Cellulophaga sp. RHA19]|uniref:porin family protein n=1 Tax=Cellulophaga sp. RHA19 TaxID=1798237 RepID=UPI000C2BFFDD|nr:porin family protein [Cellulophaga sp. RHA19]PKB42152.1 outer membrane protein with beta-barrel domain [Cellulophaga sp. RHA19]